MTVPMDPERRKQRSALLEAFAWVLDQNLGVGSSERVLVVTDPLQKWLGELAAQAARRFSPLVRLLEMPPLAFNGQEPPPPVAESLLRTDVALLLLTRSLSWTRARVAATEHGARIATLPGITPDIILRTFPVDYRPIRRRVNRLCDLLDRGDAVRVTTRLGTDLHFSISGRQAHGRKGGIYREAGHWGNLPCGEAFIAPLEGSAEGCYVVDASQAGVGAIREPIRIELCDGQAVRIKGGAQASELTSLLESIGDPAAYNLAEFGIGCNPAATLCGITLEDEKSLGTCHFALGNNTGFGGHTPVGIHVDGVLKQPDVWIDDQLILEAGKPQFPET